MKKKTRRLLTITLLVCMGLLLSAGMASAKITTADGAAINPGDILALETMVKSDFINGMDITYIIPPFDPEDNGSGEESTDMIPPDEAIDLIPAIDIYGDGYEITEWKVESIVNAESPEAEGAKDILVLKPYTIVPIEYTLEYYDSDQTTLLDKQTNVTVENAKEFTYPTPKKDGYVFSHWYRAVSDSTLPPNSSIDDFFLKSEGTPGNGFVIQFYAVWEEPAAPAPTPEPDSEPKQPLDDSPKAGDDTPVGILMFLMAIAAATWSFLQKPNNSAN